MHIKYGMDFSVLRVSALQALARFYFNSPRPNDLGRGCAGLPGLRNSVQYSGQTATRVLQVK
jgi:hypothetical protein